MSDRLLFANNATGQLALGIDALATVLQVRPQDATKFPSIIRAGETFALTIEDPTTGTREIVTATARSGASITVTRGREGTTAAAFPAGALVANRLTAASLEWVLERLNTWAGLYLGSQSTHPTTDLLGDPLQPGMVYFNTTSAGVYVYTGDEGWRVLVQPAPSAVVEYIYELSTSTATIAGPDRNNDLLEFTTDDRILVYLNGIRLIPNVDYTLGANQIQMSGTVPAGAWVHIERQAIVYRDFITTAASANTAGWTLNGANARFALVDSNGIALTPADEANCIIAVDGLIQRPGIDYTIDGTDVVFSSAPRSDSRVWAVVGLPIASESGDVFAPLASPNFTGTPTGPTAAAGTNTTQLATTAFVQGTFGDKAPLASPAFTGAPTAPTPTGNDNSTKLATTAFVQALMALRAALSGATFTGTVNVQNPTGTSRIVIGGTLDEYAHLTVQSNPGESRDIILASAVTNGTRWLLRCNAAPEAGADAGSDFEIRAMSDTGNLVFLALSIERSTGIVTFGKPPQTPFDPANDSDLTRKAYVDYIVSQRAPLSSPALTGVATSATVGEHDNSTRIATTAYVQGEVTRVHEVFKGSGYTVAATDSGQLHTCTAAMTVTVPNYATLGAEFFLEIYNGSGGTVVIDGPGGTNLSLADKESATIVTRNGMVLGIKSPPMTQL